MDSKHESTPASPPRVQSRQRQRDHRASVRLRVCLTDSQRTLHPEACWLPGSKLMRAIYNSRITVTKEALAGIRSRNVVPD